MIHELSEAGYDRLACQMACRGSLPKSAPSFPTLNVPEPEETGRAGSKSSHLNGIALTAADLQHAHVDDARSNHHRTQDLLHELLQHRGLSTTTKAPYLSDSDGEEDSASGGDIDRMDDKLRRDFTAERIFGRLRKRGIHGIRKFRSMLHQMDMLRTGTILGRTFEGALAHMGIKLKAAEFERLMQLFVTADDDEMVDYVRILAYGCSNWSYQREEVVREAYDTLCAESPGGHLCARLIERRFKSTALTTAHCPGMLEHESAKEFVSQWSSDNLSADGVIRWHDFVDYYHDVSLCFDSDPEFVGYVCDCWSISLDDWLAKKVFRQYTDRDNEDVLPAREFLRMLQDLDSTVTEEEGVIWYEAIDTDDSGEVSLEEFLSSKVLKVKRLFDDFDETDSRTVDQETMVKILTKLNDAITEEEAIAVYQYADLDGNGDVSFSEFLENNLLKLLHIFDEFDTNRTRSFNEADIKALLKRLDRYLDDYCLHACYKAIDVDSSGSVSFVEFCESQLLRAKSLFDRFDMDRSRALVQCRFEELMLDLDETLTQVELNAIWDLVADYDMQKVHLGGFLNPNIVKLKMLFDKYDADNSKCLDEEEFMRMLQDMFKSANDKEIDALLRIVHPTPGSTEGISLTTYIQKFKEISRKHDQIVLAKRRAAREKARLKGLVFVGCP